ncbi:MAG: Wzy polymerase domain-containing protein [Sulfuricellaceae bacterium]
MQKITFPRISLWLLGLMFLLPFLVNHHGLPIPSFYGEWLAAALGLAALSLFLRNRYWQDMALPIIALVPLGLIVVLLIQIPTERIVFPERNILGASYLLWAALLMMLSRTLARELGLPEVVETLAWFLLCGGVANAGIAVFQQLKIDTFLDPVILKGVRVPFANLAQPNHFSDYIALALGSLLLLFSKQRLTLGTVLATGCLLLYALSFSGSRGSWLYVITMMCLSLWFFVRDRRNEHRRLLIATVLLLLGFALLQIKWLALVPSGVITPTDNLFITAGSKSDRLAIWWEAWKIFLQAPLLGVGFGEFVWQHFLFAGQAPDEIRAGLYSHSHNIVMQVLAELGLPAALLLVIGVFAWLLRLIKADALTPEKWWILALSSVLAIHSMLEYPLWYAYFLGVAVVLLGVGETRCFRLNMQRVGRRLFVLLCFLGGMSLFNLVQSYTGFERAMYGMWKNLPQQSGLDPRQEKIKEFTRQIMLIHRESLLASYAEIAACQGILLDMENLPGKLAVNGRAMHGMPVSVIVYRQAILLELNGEHQAAARQFDLAAAAYPGEAQRVVMVLSAVLKRSVPPDQTGSWPLLRHAEAWVRAHSAGKGGAAPVQQSAVAASMVGKP